MLKLDKQTVKYLIETVKTASDYKKEFIHITKLNSSKEFKNSKLNSAIRHSAFGIIGKASYDLYTDENNKETREEIGKKSSQLLILTDIVDDVIDERKTEIKEKFKFLDAVFEDLFGYTMHYSDDVFENASYVLAQNLYDTIIYKDKEKKLEKQFSDLVAVIKKQFYEKNSQELLDIARKTGRGCSGSVAMITEILTNKQNDKVFDAINKFGEYGQIIDNVCEVDQDLKEGTNTFLTTKLRENKYNKKEIINLMQGYYQKAEIIYLQGLTGLDENQRKIYASLKNLLDFKNSKTKTSPFSLDMPKLKKIAHSLEFNPITTYQFLNKF